MQVCLDVPPFFRADLGTNLIKQGGNVKGQPSASVPRWQSARTVSEKREALGSSPGRATIFSSLVKFGISVCFRGYSNEL